MKFHQVFAHAAVHEQRTAPRVQIQDAHRNHVDGFDRREHGDILLAVTDVHQERRDGTEQEERSLCDKDNGPRRAHGKNHRRCNGNNKQQLDQHDGATIAHHKHHAIGKDCGIETQHSAHCPGANVKRRHQIRARRREQDKRRNHQVKHKARLVGANHLTVIGRAARCDEWNVDRLQARSQGKDNIERNNLGKDERNLHCHSPALGIKTIMRSWPGSPSRRYATLRPCRALSSSCAAGVCERSASSLEKSVARSSTLHRSWSPK